MAKKNSKSVTIDGVKYDSATAAAVALVEAGNSLSDAAKATGITYQTVYANTKGKEKRAEAAARRRVLALGQKGKLTVGEIATKVGMSTSRTVALLKKAGIHVLSAKEKAKLENASETKKGKKGTRKNRAKKAETAKVTETPVVDEEIKAQLDESVLLATMADMSTEYLDVLDD